MSFDVVAMFTSVPIEEALLVFEKRLRDFNTNGIEIADVIDLTRISVVQSFSQVNGKYYTQNDGLTVGSSLHPFSVNFL